MALQCGISAISACTKGVQWRTEYKVGTLPYSSEKPVKPLGYAECTPVHQKRLNFPYNSFQLCLDFSWTANYLARLKKKKGGTACRSTLLLSECLSAKSPHFLFSDLELEALSLEKRGRTGSRNGVCKGHARNHTLPTLKY